MNAHLDGNGKVSLEHRIQAGASVSGSYFETEADMNDLKVVIEFAAQVSAVAVTAGASANVKYRRCYGIYDAKGWTYV
jgi:hypothetical protein